MLAKTIKWREILWFLGCLEPWKQMNSSHKLKKIFIDCIKKFDAKKKL